MVEVRPPQRTTATVRPPAANPVTVRPMVGSPGPAGSDGSAQLAEHISDPTPHPAYDDMPSLSLIFENGLI